MAYFLYLILAPVSLVITLVAYILAPIMVLFAYPQNGWCDNHSYQSVEPRLPPWLSVFMTPDNSLLGDAAFYKLHMNDSKYWSKVKWLWRNPAYSFALRYLTPEYVTKTYGNITIKDNDNAKAGWCFVTANGLFQFRWVKPIGHSRCIYVNLGWNVFGLADPGLQPKPDPYQATFVFSPRISGYR
jgi:hypothetical protein